MEIRLSIIVLLTLAKVFGGFKGLILHPHWHSSLRKLSKNVRYGRIPEYY
jgi:hypothetical protein